MPVFQFSRRYLPPVNPEVNQGKSANIEVQGRVYIKPHNAAYVEHY